jgi:hypothetical protein
VSQGLIVLAEREYNRSANLVVIRSRRRRIRFRSCNVRGEPMMPVACPRCGVRAAGNARFCDVCGAPLRPPPAPQHHAGATGPTLRLGRAHTPGRVTIGPRDGIPLVGLLFSALFLVAFAQLLANGWLRDFGPWPAGLLLGGALLAERAWVNGEVWIGLRGMLLWGGLTGLLAVGHAFPWALLLIPSWLMLWLLARSRRP